MTAVVDLPLDTPERYLSRAEIADFMSVSERTIDRWATEGMPYETWGLRTKKFRASECVRWAHRRTPSRRPGSQTLVQPSPGHSR